MGRFGSFLLASDNGFGGSFQQTLESIAAALEEDPRVVSVQRPKGIEDDWCGEPKLFPAPAQSDALVSGNDAFHGLYFNRRLRFAITVPEKNQPKKKETDKVPTDYHVIWDGMLMLVTWRTTRKSLPLSGGHVVSEVLNDALKKSGLRLYVQGCNPACSHEFAHMNIRFSEEVDRDEVEYVEGTDWDEVNALVPTMDDDKVAMRVFRDIRSSAHSFTRLKNYGRRILEAETQGRVALAGLMSINYSRASLPTQTFWERTKSRWEMRGWLRGARFLIAEIWLILSNIESLRREWHKIRLEFEGDVDERGKAMLFALDYADEVDRVDSLDLGPMQAGVQEIAERLDSRALLRITAIAGIAGAITGGLVGGIAGNGF